MEEDGEGGDLPPPSSSILVPLHLLLLLLLLLQQGRQDQLQSLGVNVPGGGKLMFYSIRRGMLDANSTELTFFRKDQPAKCFF